MKEALVYYGIVTHTYFKTCLILKINDLVKIKERKKSFIHNHKRHEYKHFTQHEKHTKSLFIYYITQDNILFDVNNVMINGVRRHIMPQAASELKINTTKLSSRVSVP